MKLVNPYTQNGLTWGNHPGSASNYPSSSTPKPIPSNSGSSCPSTENSPTNEYLPEKAFSATPEPASRILSVPENNEEATAQYINILAGGERRKLRSVMLELPKTELHLHLAGGIPPLKWLHWACEANLYYDFELKKFIPEPKTGRIPLNLDFFKDPKQSKYSEKIKALYSQQVGEFAATYHLDSGNDETWSKFFCQHSIQYFDSYRCDAWKPITNCVVRSLSEGREAVEVLMKDNPWVLDITKRMTVENEIEKRNCQGHIKFFEAWFPISSIADSSSRIKQVAYIVEKLARHNIKYAEIKIDIYAGAPELPDYLKDEKKFNLGDLEVSLKRLQESDWMKEFKSYAKALLDECSNVTAKKIKRNGFEIERKISNVKSPVYVKFMPEVMRDQPNPIYFAHFAAGLELCKEGVCLAPDSVGQEDNPQSLNNFDAQIKIIKFLRDKICPTAKLTAHAGELSENTWGLEHGSSHIGALVEIVHRLAHFVSYPEEKLKDLIRQIMIEKEKFVEILLTSNKKMLKVWGEMHVVRTLVEEGIRFGFCEDDGGVLATDLSGELIQAILDHGFGYMDIKATERNKIHHSFMEGESIYEGERDEENKPTGPLKLKQVFRETKLSEWKTNPYTRAILQQSEKAYKQYQFEKAYAVFEEECAKKLAPYLDTKRQGRGSPIKK